MDDATKILGDLAAGDRDSADRLFGMIYDELRRVAGAYFRGQPADHTLQPTALVHEAYLRMVDQVASGDDDRAHFFAIAATAMRQILVSHARSRSALKRGGDRPHLQVDAVPLAADDGIVADLLALDEALDRLAAFDERKARVVEARFFGGLTVEQTALVLGVSVTTVEGDWRLARAWLSRELGEGTVT